MAKGDRVYKWNDGSYKSKPEFGEISGDNRSKAEKLWDDGPSAQKTVPADTGAVSSDSESAAAGDTSATTGDSGATTGDSSATSGSSETTSSSTDEAADTDAGTSSTVSDDEDSKPKQLVTNNNAIYQDFELYIEGEKCPFESASISYGVSIIPEMVIQLVPFKILRSLGERTRVHLYFVDPVDRQKRLLFDGEISGVGYTKNPSSQMLTYTVSHVSKYLDEVLVSFFDLSSYATSVQPMHVEGSGTSLSMDYSMYEHGTLEKLFNPKGALLSDDVNSFQDVFKKIFEEIYKTKNATVNYLKEKMDEWKLKKRLVALPLAKEGGSLDAVLTLKNFLKESDSLSMLRQAARKLDGMHSVFSVFGEVFSRVFYSPVIIPTAYLKKDKQILQTVLYKPQALFVLPPACNVVWPSMYNVFSYSRNFKSIPTRQFARLDAYKVYNSKNSSGAGTLECLAQYVWSPEELRDEMDKANSKSKAVASGRAKGKKSVTKHKRLLNVLTKEEEGIGVKLTQPDRNELFVEYLEFLERTSKNKDTNKETMNRLLDYELTRQRFETSLTSVNMVFNPYLVPGFPCLIMDKPESGMHVYGYAMSIAHTIAKGSVSTTTEIGYVRQYDEPVENKFFLAEDIWADEGAVYKAVLGVSSIKDASFNTMEDKEKRGDPTEIPKHLEEAMDSETFYDYVYNAYARIHRPIVTKDKYDEFVKGIKYDTTVQEKIKKYRSWVTGRVAVHDYEEKKE